VRLPRLALVALLSLAADVVRAASLEDRVAVLFRPPQAEWIALSPDGQRVAYTVQSGRELAIMLVNVEPPGPRRRIRVEPNRDAASTDEAPPVPLRFLRWATPNRLVFAPAERVLPLPPVTGADGRPAANPDGPTIVAPILAVDADGKFRGTLVDARDFLETSASPRTLADLLRTPQQLMASRHEPSHWRMPHLDILGFLPRNREQLIIGTHGGFGLPAQHAVDVRTGTVSEFGGNWPAPPPAPQVFDWFRFKVVGERRTAARPATAWRDDELGRVQQDLEAKFPRRIVEILDWSETRARVLFRVTGGSDPGRVFVLQRPENLALEILRRAPWLSAAKLNDTRYFEFAAPDGARLSGYLTWPKSPRRTPPPLLTVLPAEFPGGLHLPFDPEAEVFADLGFAVARLNHRALGEGRAENSTALRVAGERDLIGDVRTALEGMAARWPDRPFDRRRVAVLGRKLGGYLALRALQLEPAAFRCGIAIDAALDSRSGLPSTGTPFLDAPPVAARPVPVAFFDAAAAEGRPPSLLDEAEALVNPVLLLVAPGRNPAIDAATEALRARLQALGRPPEQLELEPDLAAMRPPARAAVYRKIEEFLGRHLDGYTVKIGPAKEVE